MNKKAKEKKGFTFVEMLLSVLLVGLLTTVVAAGSTTALRVYRQGVGYAESRVLSVTLLKAMENELRYAEDLQTKNVNIGEDTINTVVFNGSAYGNEAFFYVNQDDGYVYVKRKDAGTGELLLGQKMYPNGLGVKSLEIATAPADNANGAYGELITVTLEMKDGDTVSSQILNVNKKKTNG